MSRSFYGRTGIEFTNSMASGLSKYAADLRPRVVSAVEDAAELVRSKAYDLANVSAGPGNAVGGGHMRDHIDVTVIETANAVSAKIGIDLAVVPYAPHQEFGSRGKPFLRPALDESRVEAHEIMRAALDGSTVTGSTAVRFRRFA